MSIPFSNTNLRIPRGFGNILEGLAREVLRNQPEDIPAFAAVYFNALLKEREESGMDPAEWGAKLEDRFYNNHSFKVNSSQNRESQASPLQTAQEKDEKDVSTSPVQEPWPQETLNENSTEESMGITESDIIQPVHITAVATANFSVFDDVPGVENWGGDGTGGQANKDICSAELEPEPSNSGSYGRVADVDICATELGGAEESAVQRSDGDSEVGGAKREMDLAFALESPMPQEQAEPAEGDVPTEPQRCMLGSPESLLLDFETGRINTPEVEKPEEPLSKEAIVEDTQGDGTETVEALGEEGDGQEGKVEDTDLKQTVESSDVSPGQEHLEGGGLPEDKSGNEVQAGEEDVLHKDTIVEAKEEATPLQMGLDAAVEEGCPDEENIQESIDPQPFTEEASEKTTITEDEDTNENLPQQNSPETESDGKADDEGGVDHDHDDDDDEVKEEMKTETVAEERESEHKEEQSLMGDLQDETLEQTESTAKKTELETGEQTAGTSHVVTQEEGELEEEAEAVSHGNEDSVEQEEAKEAVTAEGLSDVKEECSHPQEEEDVMDIPLDDPEANKAAAKIQAGFRGHMTRKKMKDDKPREEVSSTGDALNGSQLDSEPAGSEGVEADDTSAPEQ